MTATLEQTFREQWGRVLAALIGSLGDIDLAEEAVLSRSKCGPACDDHNCGPWRGCKRRIVIESYLLSDSDRALDFDVMIFGLGKTSVSRANQEAQKIKIIV